MQTSADDLQTLIGRALRKCRRDAELSREELADALDLDARRIADYEAGRVELEAAMLWRMCQAIGLSIDEFCREVSALSNPADTPADAALRHLGLDPAIWAATRPPG